MDLSRVRIVLYQVQAPDNLGAVARAMKNAGLARLVLAAAVTRDLGSARRVAVDSEEILDRAVIAGSLAEALAGATYVVGTTSRAVDGRPAITPREVAEAVSSATAAEEAAIVFGGERRGLSNAELDLCPRVATIPASPAKSSMNLAQAVAVFGYELFLRSLEAPAEAPPRPRAPAEALERLYARMREVLLGAGFLSPQNPELILSELKRLLERGEPTPREAELWLAAFKQLERAMKR